MRKLSASMLYAAAMIITVVGMDLLLFRHHFGQRLAANVGVVLLFVAFYWRYIRLSK